MIHVEKPTAPAILRKRGAAAGAELCAAFDTDPAGYRSGRRKFKFLKSIYKAQAVQKALDVAQYSKCAFCESHYSHNSYGNVEHFRPKAGYKQSGDRSLSRPGYYWLAYDWANLFNSCEICNQRFKSNLFPLKMPARRALCHHDSLEDETPLLINPGVEDPEQFIGFHDEFPFAIKNSRRGLETIQVLGLDREPLNDQRRRRLEGVQNLVDLCKVLKHDLQNGITEASDRLELAEKRLRFSLAASSEYASMCRCFVADQQ